MHESVERRCPELLGFLHGGRSEGPHAAMKGREILASLTKAQRSSR
jgi:hypothetical protein